MTNDATATAFLAKRYERLNAITRAIALGTTTRRATARDVAILDTEIRTVTYLFPHLDADVIRRHAIARETTRYMRAREAAAEFDRA